MKLAVTIDVEEEGLFRGTYDSRNTSVANVSQLRRLTPIFLEWGVHPTLLVTYPVARCDPAIDLLLELRDTWNCEIGAHLHPWNTPPLERLNYDEPVPSELMPAELLKARLATLLEALAQKGIKPTSFRMGRFNMGPKMFSVLQETGINVDSSIAPMHRYYGGPDHLCAPTDPYRPDPLDPRRPGNSKILEVPLTTVPLTRGLGRFLEALGGPILPRSWVSWFAMYLGTLSVQPLGTGLRRIKAGVLIHSARGGQVLTIFFHSSELMEGGSPENPTPEHINRFLERLSNFFSWIHKRMTIESLTLSQLDNLYRQKEP